MSVCIVTLIEAGKTYRLSDLIANYDVDPLPRPLNTAALEIRVQAHPDNDGKVYGGEDEHVSFLRYAYVLTPTSGERTYFTGLITNATSKYFVADTADQRLLVELVND